MTTVNKDVDSIAAEPVPITLSSGERVHIERLKTRQLFKLLKVLTRGAGEALSSLDISTDMDAEEFTGQLLAAVVISIPEAEDEAIEFIQSMVSPVGLIIPPRSKDDKKKNDDLYDAIASSLYNPELEDTINIIEQVVVNEASEIQALGKRLGGLLKKALPAVPEA